MLKQIWSASKLTETSDENEESLKWRKLGFDTENLTREFGDVGVLGLDCLVCNSSVYVFVPNFFWFLQRNFAQNDPDSFAQVCGRKRRFLCTYF